MMSAEVILLVGLCAVFILPIVTDLNVGIVAFVVAILTGTFLLDQSANEILSGFPGQMFILLVGITLLLSIADSNGTVAWVVQKLIRLAGGRLILLPWVLFGIALLTSSLGPGSAPVLFVIGVGFIARFNLNPLLVAAMIIHGTQSGAYSPVAPYGVVISQLAAAQGILYSPVMMYVGVVGFHLVLVVTVFFVLGGHKLAGQRVDVADLLVDGDTGLSSATRIQYVTLAGFLVLLVGVLVYKLNLGFLAMVISFILLLATPREGRQKAIDGIAWPIILVITGVLTYVNLMQGAGTIEWLAVQAASVGSSTFIGLLLCLVVAVVTGVASTMGTIGMLVPLSAPFILSGDLDGTGLLTAMAISAASSDISPFSTWGALFLATAAAVRDRQMLLKSQLLYTLAIVCIVPVTAWFLFVVL